MQSLIEVPTRTCTAILWYVPAGSDQLSMPIVTCVGAPHSSSMHCVQLEVGRCWDDALHTTAAGAYCVASDEGKANGSQELKCCEHPPMCNRSQGLRNLSPAHALMLTCAAVITTRELTSVPPHLNHVPSLRTHHLQAAR